MRNFFGTLAAVDYLNPIATPGDSTPRMLSKDLFTTLAVLVGLALLLLIAVAFFRRKKIRRQGNLSRSAWPASASKNTNPGGSLRPRDGHRPRRRHRHRREHRPRNPTLADTGGLPPKRPDDQPPKSV